MFNHEVLILCCW